MMDFTRDRLHAIGGVGQVFQGQREGVHVGTVGDVPFVKKTHRIPRTIGCFLRIHPNRFCSAANRSVLPAVENAPGVFDIGACR